MTAANLSLKRRNTAPQIKAQIERYLFVARSSGVETLAQVADTLDELPLDKRVHVFVRTFQER